MPDPSDTVGEKVTGCAGYPEAVYAASERTVPFKVPGQVILGGLASVTLIVKTQVARLFA